MKKMMLALVAMVLAVAANAQKYNLPLNEAGDIVFAETLQGSGDAAANFTKVKTWINTQGFKNIAVNQEETGKKLNYLLTKNTKTSYNPFAGQFIEDLIINFVAEFDGNNVKYSLQNIQLQEQYAGYGVNNKINPLASRLKEVQAAEKAIADAQAAGDKKAAKKLKKEHEDLIENGNETLEKASTEIQNLLTSLRSTLK